MSKQDARWREAAGGDPHDEAPLETAYILVACIVGATAVGLGLALAVYLVRVWL